MSDTRNHPSSGTEPNGLRSPALAGYRWMLLAFLPAGCVQIFLAGLGVFSFGDHDVAGGTSAFDAHRTLGFTMAGVAVIILVLAVIRCAVALARQPVDEPGADGRRPGRPRPGDALPVITGQTGLDPIFQGAADFDLKLIESRTLDGHTQELIYRPALHV
jgi:hypothetical protein